MPNVWLVVCSEAPHLQFENGARLHLCIDEQHRSTTERRRLILTQDAQGKSIGLVLALGMKACIADTLLEYLMFHFVFAYWAARMPVSDSLRYCYTR